MATFERSTSTNWSDPTSSLGDFPASHPVMQESDEAGMMNDGCGLSSPEPFASYDPDTCSWRTSQVSSLPSEIESASELFSELQLTRFSGTWPQAGMMRSGRVSLQRRLAPRISETASGLWPTPTQADGIRLRLSSQHILNAIASHHRRKKKLGTYLARRTAVEYGASPTPELSEFLMGFPIGWTDLEDSATP